MVKLRLFSCLVLGLSIAGCGDNLGAPSDARGPDAEGGADAAPDVGVTVTPTSGLTTTEAGGEDTFTVVLDSPPTENVTIDLSSDDTGEGTVSPASITFTSENWNAPRTVTVKGVDDDIADEDTDYTIVLSPAESDDDRYDGLDPDDVQVTNDDDESPGITVTESAGGVITNENGSSDTFTIVLDSEPSADVTIDVSSDDDTEGTVFPESLTFTPDNWNAPQEIVVTGVDDDDDDGPIMYDIVTDPAVSGDAGYAGIDPDDVIATNIDDDTPGMTVVPSADPLLTGENGDSATFTITLNSQPLGDVTVTLDVDDDTEGELDDPTPIVFTTENWNSLVEVTVNGVDDDLDDLDQPYSVSITVTSVDDAGYDGLVVPDVDLVNVDDDSPGVTVSPVSGDTTESGGQATFTVTLNSEPTSNVTVTLFSENEGEGTVDPIEIIFTPINWNSLVEVTITGVNDDVPDGNQQYFINIEPVESDDDGYDGIDPPNVSVTNIDNDTPGTIVTPIIGLVTSELLETAEFTIVLTTQPTLPVTIALSSSDETEGTLEVPSVTFTALNWDEPQLVVVTGVDDALIDGNQPYTIVTGLTDSLDPDYDGLPVDDVSVVNIDDESPFLVIQPRRKLHFVNENGTVTTTLQIRLSVQPTDDVTCTFATSDATEGDIDLTTLTFTTDNWDTRQDIIVSGVDDDLLDGDQRFNVITNPCTSNDLAYSGFDAVNIPVLNRDNE